MSEEHKDPGETAPQDKTADDGGDGYRHNVDMRFAVPWWLGGHYWDLRMGRNVRAKKRPHIIPRRVKRSNRLLIAFGLQMAMGWAVAIGLAFYWGTQTACGGGVMSTPTTTAPAATTPVTTRQADPEQVQADVHRLINEYRVAQGLEALQANPDIEGVATGYSGWMASAGFFDHVDPDGGTFSSRLKGAGVTYHAAGENLAMYGGGGEPAQAIVDMWLNSPSHKANIYKASYEETGVGVALGSDGILKVTQLFLRP